jgi:hypothetical protein
MSLLQPQRTANVATRLNRKPAQRVDSPQGPSTLPKTEISHARSPLLERAAFWKRPSAAATSGSAQHRTRVKQTRLAIIPI